MFGSLGFTEILFIFIIALIIFGPRKLPELGKSLGETLGQFKRASEDFKRSWEREVEVEKKRIMEPAKPAERAGASTRAAEAAPTVPRGAGLPADSEDADTGEQTV
jgi:TatA/E family protein of Tat protein translocase